MVGSRRMSSTYSHGVRIQRRNLQHGEDDIRLVFGVMIMSRVSDGVLRAHVGGNPTSESTKLRCS